jgi:opacity protein-like surface antigen
VDDKDSGVGFWACGGVIYRPGDSLNFGLDIRYTDTDVSLNTIGVAPDLKLDTGGFHYGLMIGYHW